MDGRVVVCVLVVVSTQVAGCPVAPGPETPDDRQSRDLSVLVENRAPERPTRVTFRLTEGEAVLWNETETLEAIEYREQSVVVHRDSQFTLSVSVGDSSRRYEWNTSACNHFRVRVTFAPDGSVTQDQFCGEAWLREF